MTSNFIAVALFAAFVVGGILGEIVPLWAVVLVGLAVAVAAFVVMDRYPGVRKRGRTQPAPERAEVSDTQPAPARTEVPK
jgi:hypothetical protein